MKRVILVCVVAVMFVQQKASDNSVRNNGQQNPPHEQAKTNGAPSSQSSANPSDQKPARDADKGQSQKVDVVSVPKVGVKSEKDVLDWTILFCTVVLTIVGVIGTWAAVRTLKQIKRQADTLDEHKTKFDELAIAATNNATFAQLNADALINSERPWLFISPVEFRPEPYPRNRFDWRIRNKGRTVANVIEVKLSSGIYPGLGQMLKTPPEYKLKIDFHGVPLAPDGVLDAWGVIESNKPGSDAALTAADLDNVRAGRTELVAYASILYRDQFGRMHESRFCFYYASVFQEFRINLVAPPDYHQCT